MAVKAPVDTLEGVISPRLKLSVGVVVELVTVPVTPFALVKLKDVTEPPEPVALKVPLANDQPDPIETVVNPPPILPDKIALPVV